MIMDHNAILFSYDTRVDFYVFWFILGLSVLSFFAYLAFRQFKIDKRELYVVLFFEYIILVLLLTVFFRETPIYPEGFQKSLFGDKTMLSGSLFIERFFNIVLFLPIGALLFLLQNSHKMLHTFLFGLLFSSFIEVMQYVFNKGVADIEDVICNVLGVMLGAAISMTIRVLKIKGIL